MIYKVLCEPVRPHFLPFYAHSVQSTCPFIIHQAHQALFCLRAFANSIWQLYTSFNAKEITSNDCGHARPTLQPDVSIPSVIPDQTQSCPACLAGRGTDEAEKEPLLLPLLISNSQRLCFQ